MNLVDLEAVFLKVERPGHHQQVDTLVDAQGIRFLCPLGCGHYVGVWFRNRGVPDSEEPGPARWFVVSGTGLADLTLTPSIHLTGPGCGWHGFVTAGDIDTV